ncbi:MAG: hypothetical protein HYU66_11640 [Armatimonadetes bacterium]|nr:hypothetical protein [Armatimonadota bacterium]
MAEVVTVPVQLDQLLVDPRLSPRRVPVDEDYLDRLSEVLAEGGELPPPKIAFVGDRTAPWCSCQRAHQKRQLAEWHAESARIAWCQRPPMPEYVLYDGLTTFWALRRAGVKKAVCELRTDSVADGAEVTCLAAIANGTHGRKLEDADLRVTFARLWLGRAVRETHETWVPGAGGMELGEVARRLGRSEGWATQMRAYCEVHQGIGLDLGVSRSYALSRMPAERWWSFCWCADNLRLHPLLGEDLVPLFESHQPVTRLSREQIERHVQAASTSPPGPLSASREGESDTGQGTLPLGSERFYDGQLPLSGWDEYRGWARTLFDAAPRMSPDQVKQAREAFQPAYLDTCHAWRRLGEEARRLGLED